MRWVMLDNEWIHHDHGPGWSIVRSYVNYWDFLVNFTSLLSIDPTCRLISWLQAQSEEDAFVVVEVQQGQNKGFSFKTHPKIDKQLYGQQNLLGLKDPDQPFPVGSSVGILKWHLKVRASPVSSFVQYANSISKLYLIRLELYQFKKTFYFIRLLSNSVSKRQWPWAHHHRSGCLWKT